MKIILAPWNLRNANKNIVTILNDQKNLTLSYNGGIPTAISVPYIDLYITLRSYNRKNLTSFRRTTYFGYYLSRDRWKKAPKNIPTGYTYEETYGNVKVIFEKERSWDFITIHVTKIPVEYIFNHEEDDYPYLNLSEENQFLYHTNRDLKSLIKNLEKQERDLKEKVQRFFLNFHSLSQASPAQIEDLEEEFANFSDSIDKLKLMHNKLPASVTQHNNKKITNLKETLELWHAIHDDYKKHQDIYNKKFKNMSLAKDLLEQHKTLEKKRQKNKNDLYLLGNNATKELNSRKSSLAKFSMTLDEFQESCNELLSISEDTHEECQHIEFYKETLQTWKNMHEKDQKELNLRNNANLHIIIHTGKMQAPRIQTKNIEDTPLIRVHENQTGKSAYDLAETIADKAKANSNKIVKIDIVDRTFSRGHNNTSVNIYHGPIELNSEEKVDRFIENTIIKIMSSSKAKTVIFINRSHGDPDWINSNKKSSYPLSTCYGKRIRSRQIWSAIAKNTSIKKFLAIIASCGSKSFGDRNNRKNIKTPNFTVISSVPESYVSFSSRKYERSFFLDRINDLLKSKNIDSFKQLSCLINDQAKCGFCEKKFHSFADYQRPCEDGPVNKLANGQCRAIYFSNCTTEGDMSPSDFGL